MGEEEDCVDKKGKFLLKLKKKKGKVVLKKLMKCNKLRKMKNEKRRTNICAKTKRHKKHGPAQELCLKTCKICEENNDDEGGGGDEDEDENEEEEEDCVDK